LPEVPSNADALRTYDVAPGTLVLVRPDGYVGLVTDVPASVERYLCGVSPAR
jgi:hypothetical protein